MKPKTLTFMLATGLRRLVKPGLVALLVLAMGPGLLSASHLPQSCQDIKNANAAAPDGDYTIFPNNNTQVFTVSCHDMAGTPKEYLTLVNTGGPVPSFGANLTFPNSFNYSMLEANGPLFHTITFWSKVRLNPGTLKVDINDFTFATNATSSSCCPGFKMPYAVAEACAGGVVTSYANVNLVGTPFAVAADQAWVLFVVGFANRSSNDQVVNLGVGGSCGQINPTDNSTLKLAYIGPAFVHPQPFAAFTAKVEIELGAATDDAFEVKSNFTLGAGNNGINPLTEIVSLQLTGGTGSFSTTIPADSFKQDKKGRFKFEGTINGVELEAQIRQLGGDQFEFKAEGEHADLTGIPNPVTVTLTIGNDSGSATVTAEFEDDDD